jgi:ribosomal protein S18 acetylase RimI-like enzyme
MPLQVRTAVVDDAPAVARVFEECFPDSIGRLFPQGLPPWVLDRIMAFIITSEPGCCSVALSEQGDVLAYCVAVPSMPRFWCRALVSPRLGGLLGAVLTGKIPIGLRQAKLMARDKLAFFSSFRSFSLRGGTGQILSVGVSTGARGRGRGRLVVMAGLSYLKASGARAVKLEVRPDNQPAVRLYRSLGFTKVGATKDSRGQWMVMTLKFA